jgi:hypothetical protein
MMDMNPPRRANSYTLEPELEGLDPSSAWVGDECADIPPVALEPYDWTLDDDATAAKQGSQLIPIPPTVRSGSTTSRKPKRKSDSSEASVLIPVEKNAAGQPVPVEKNAAEQPIPVEKNAAGQPIPVEKNGAGRHAKAVIVPPVPMAAPSAPNLATGQIARNGAAKPATAPTQHVTQITPIQHTRVTKALPRPRRLVSSMLLLLLSVIAVFVFAYIAQK